MDAHLKAIRKLYQPSIGSMTSHLPTMGESLDEACRALADDCTLERVDLMLARVKSAETNLVHLRKALIAERSTGHGTG